MSCLEIVTVTELGLGLGLGLVYNTYTMLNNYHIVYKHEVRVSHVKLQDYQLNSTQRVVTDARVNTSLSISL